MEPAHIIFATFDDEPPVINSGIWMTEVGLIEGFSTLVIGFSLDEGYCPAVDISAGWDGDRSFDYFMNVS